MSSEFSINNSNGDVAGSNRRGGGLTAAQRARREEEKRRQDSINDVVPGKTSAIPGTSDFTIDIQKTEEVWFSQASLLERKIRESTDKAMDCLRMLKVEEAEKAFDIVYQFNPNAYCWQAGIAKFYLGKFYEAAECFVNNAILYESKFGQAASEERIWRDACELKLKASSTSLGETKIKHDLAAIPRFEGDKYDEKPLKESRKVIRIARNLFSASAESNLANVVLARAKLHSICGQSNTREQEKSPFLRNDVKMWRLSAWFYLGLHYDVIGDFKESKKCFKMALRLCTSSGNSNDIVQVLPMLHMTRRDWYDDDNFEEYTQHVTQELKSFIEETYFKETSIGNVDLLAIKSMMDSLEKMRRVELQDCLKKRHIKSSGSKSVLKDRLLRSLIGNDVNLRESWYFSDSISDNSTLSDATSS